MKLIKQGTILTAETEFVGDILIDGEKIIEVGEHISAPEATVVDASGRYVFPGGVDEHTHFGSFGGKLFETTSAAAVGGTTTFVDFAPQDRGDSLTQAIEKHAGKAGGVSSVDYAFHIMVMDLQKDTFDQIGELPKHGVSSLKMFMAYKGTPFFMDDEAILRAMYETKKYGLSMMVHAENADMITIITEQLKKAGKTEPVNHYYSRPPISETEATRHAIQLAKCADSPLFVVHVSTKGAMEAIRDAFLQGQSVYGETCTHYLTLDTSYLARENFEGAKYVCAPPLRPTEHLDALWEAVAKGWLNAVSSDHCALEGGFETKKLGMGDFSKIPNGAPGIQSRLVMLWSQGVATGKISRQKFVDLAATTPAKNIGLKEKGQLAPGFDADIVIFDPDYRGTITVADSLEGIDYTTFEGFPMIGRPEKVFLRGRLIAEKGKYVGKMGDGKRLYAQPYALPFQHYNKFSKS